ncbi:ABC transporter permease [Neglecta sp. X4]|uniref:methionine ABC transporter permease n=1 Tax=unclassified Neglectibacter TaxID=2632164 RepID=UPI00136E94A1|nr:MULTISPECIES: methionine ABC transporter permease [unclassified Neglectibacter]NBI16784.1 ABC transporter permease [Neglectibacter sp. 59]NBJ72197.1 ABC transporter permease [Neglectibacter sp. X4]NCE80051.1 ABC transporter permease [Neglectibacter sp. X58]
MTGIILTALWQTLYMVFWSTLLSVIIGFIPAIILTLTAPDGLRPIRPVYEILSFLVNVFRSFPFVILLVLVIPFTRLVVGKAIGTTASIVPLTLSAIPFIARIIETALRETDAGVIEAAKSFGASNWQILWRVYIKESIPRILNGIVLLIISLVGYSAMAGTVGGGGIGDIAIRFGYQQYRTDYLVVCSIILIIFVQLIQMIGNHLYKRLS